MTAGSAQPRGAEFFTAPEQVNHRRYEALRAFFVEGATHAEAAERFGYTRWAMVALVRDYRAGKLDLFAPARKPGPPPGAAPAKDRVRGTVIALRRQGLSAYEISAHLAAEGTPLNRTSVAEILTEEGFGRLLRHPQPEASTSIATPGRDTTLPPAARLDFDTLPDRADTTMAGLLLVIPDLIALDLPALIRAAGYPGTRAIPAVSWLLSLLSLKLTGTRRVSHVDDHLLIDPGAALFAGLSTLPKKTALTDYSYRLSHDHQRRFLTALDTAMIGSGLASAEQAIFDLDFHAIMHWGRDPALEKHYVPTRSQRSRSVLTFFAQDCGTHNLVYANAEVSKATQNREAIAFADHWKHVSGTEPAMLVMDQKVTTHAVLGELDARGIKFLTLRMRSPALIKQINDLTPGDYKTITLDRPGPHHKPRVHESTTVHLSKYPGTVRQFIVTGLGREAPTVIITNDRGSTTRALIERYARRMTIEQRLAEIIRAFHTDALSSAVNLNVDLDIVLCVLAQALTAALRQRLPGYATVTPDTLQRR
ncbi:MAG TPA: hypothetical protein VIV12_01120, partial [Streptosporangiaceae bacterium]